MTGLLNEWGRFWYEHFALMVVQNTVFLGMVFAALYWMRNASARIRHIIALAGLLKLVTPPFIPITLSKTLGYVELPVIAAMPFQPAAASAGPAAAGSVPLSPAGLLFGIWCSVTLAALLYTLITTIGLRVSLRHAVDADDGDSRAWARLNRIRVRITDRIAVPMTVGFFPRTIFVPPHWTNWSSPGRRAVLGHEMAHIHRRDGIVRAFETAVRALYWFHPLVLLLTRRIDAYREQACDDKAVPPGPNGRLAYSRLLVEIAEHLLHQVQVRGSAFTLMRRRNELLGRVNYLTKEESIMNISRTRLIALAAALTVAIISLSWYHGSATPPPPQKKDHPQVRLSLSSGDHITVDGKKTKLDQVGTILADQIDGKNAVVNIKCDEDVQMKTLFQMHAILRAADMNKVSYSGFIGERVPLVLPNQEVMERAKSLPAEDIISIEVAAGGTCTIDGLNLNASMIQEIVSKRLAENDKRVVSLRMADDATYGQYVQTLKALKAAQANRIFINEPGQF